MTKPLDSIDGSTAKAQPSVSILIVDDDSTKRFALKTVLALAGTTPAPDVILGSLSLIVMR